MINDALEHDERLRLEALNMALQDSMRKPPPSAENIIEVAKRFEAYIKGDND